MRKPSASPLAFAACVVAASAWLSAAPAAQAAAEVGERGVAEEAREGEREGKSRKSHIPADPALLEVTSPASGDRFSAGETITLTWREGAAFDAERSRIEEWEAFLSLDGGGHYPIRLTPHLDRELRSFAVRLPEQATAEARFLIRLGDEIRELEFELPWTFEIAAADAAAGSAVRTYASGRGEAARGGEQGVVSWVEGDRDGQRLRAIEAPPDDPSWRSVEAGSMVDLAAVAPTSRIPSIPLCAPFSHPESGDGAPKLLKASESATPSFEPRNQTCRINE